MLFWSCFSLAWWGWTSCLLFYCILPFLLIKFLLISIKKYLQRTPCDRDAISKLNVTVSIHNYELGSMQDISIRSISSNELRSCDEWKMVSKRTDRLAGWHYLFVKVVDSRLPLYWIVATKWRWCTKESILKLEISTIMFSNPKCERKKM